MVKKVLMGAAVAASVIGCATVEEKAEVKQEVKQAAVPAAKPVTRPVSPSCRESKMPFKLGVARYTMHAHTLDRALEILQNIDCHYLGLMEDTIKYDATDEEIAAYKEKCARYGVEVVSAGPLYFCKEEDLKACCEFAKRYGMKYISVVPYEVKQGKKDEWGANRLESDRMIDLLEKYAKQYDLGMAIHNHGPDMPTLFPTGEAALKRIAGRDKRLGVCIDVGHERRAGLDPVEFIRKNADRIIEVHLKNIKIDPVKNFAKEGPRGELDIPGILKALGDVGFDGYCLVEFEKDFKLNEAPLAESFGYYRGVMDTIRLNPKMQGVPAGANTLTAQEKQEGYELLFDGKNLPADKFVGVKNEFKSFPSKGWFVKDGCLTMRPVNGIHEGAWFPLPPEDQKLGGGGDIATKKTYRDFCFKFDYRLTRAANSGVKYFLDEKQNGGSCEEYQVLENEHPDSSKGRNGNRKAGSLYDIFPGNADSIQKGVGQWNSGMIVAKGTKVEHWLNGQKVLEYDRASKAFTDGVNASKYAKWGKDAAGNPQPWGLVPAGRILLQDHSDSTVSFCNLKVREL